jgi:DNA repair protein RadC
MPSTRTVSSEQDRIIANACEILEERLKYRATRGHPIGSPDDVRNLLKLRFAEYEHEVFSALFFDNRHRLIAFEELAQGTIDGAQIYPREIVRAAIRHNAGAVMFCHNHPSGVAEPSSADERITHRLRDALALIDVRVLDHFVVGDSIVSFAERGLL